MREKPNIFFWVARISMAKRMHARLVKCARAEYEIRQKYARASVMEHKRFESHQHISQIAHRAYNNHAYVKQLQV